MESFFIASLLIVTCAKENNISTYFLNNHRLIIDYLTDHIIDRSNHVQGQPKLSIDNRFLATYDSHSQKFYYESLEYGRVKKLSFYKNL